MTQGPFQAQPLGTVVVSPASTLAGTVPAAAQGAPAANASGGTAPTFNPWLVLALLLACGGAAILFGTRVAALTVRPRSA